MIQYLEGDLFSTPAQTIVNTVNTVGVMGKGIALTFKKRYPDMFDSYRKACENHSFKTGKLMLFYESDYWVLLFPTKQHWRNPSRLEYIEEGLRNFRDNYALKGITSIAFPRLGCGNGELDWNDVKPLMERYLDKIPIDVYIYLKNGDDLLPEHKNQKEITEWLKENAKDLSFFAVKDDIISHCSFLPYSFHHNRHIVEVSYDSEFSFQSENTAIFKVPEKQMFQIWDEIRETKVFARKEDDPFDLVCDLLFSLGYLTRVRINKGRDIKEGFQINEGKGRKFSLENE